MADSIAWKPFFWDRVVRAENITLYAKRVIAAASPEIRSPMSTADAEMVFRGITSAEAHLADASSAIGLAMSLMGTVDLVGVRYTRSSDRAELRAQVCLRAARARGEEVHEAIGRCRGHLGTAALLLSCPDLPEVDDLIDAERVTAVRELEVALQGTVDVGGLISAARGPTARGPASCYGGVRHFHHRRRLRLRSGR
ncbi:hypothetical protein BRADI_1g10400v3 [Brachypodium distachyon]|uniref:Uncharacterized protein n=1 Tax=Brachypodium distachyon TaxID=15368 RepID=I1GNW6_BRADI|nr:hypothetical protein BRADI_1g10400v3 [Brachypodium distachyon]